MSKPLTLNETVREAITIALIRLMTQKPLAEIPITEIVKSAGVSRNSFYRNFDSREQVLCAHINSLYRSFFAEQEVPLHLQDRNALHSFYLLRFQFVKKHRDFFSGLCRSNLLEYAFEHLDRDLLLRISGLEPSANEYALAVSCSACAGMIRAWIINDFRESEEELASVFSSIICALNSQNNSQKLSDPSPAPGGNSPDRLPVSFP